MGLGLHTKLGNSGPAHHSQSLISPRTLPSGITTNRGLLVFSILLILVGLGSGYDLLFVIGFFLLFPALLVTSKPRPQAPQPPQTSSGQQPVRRPPPQPTPSYEMAPTPPKTQMVVPPPMPPVQTSQVSYSPPLFPTSMFLGSSQPLPIGTPPGASQSAPATQPPKEVRVEARESRDELLEIGAVLLLLKLAFG